MPPLLPAVMDLLREECGFTGRSVVADVGSGTGILTRMLLENGSTVYAVEPNAAMREAGERLLGTYPGFRTAEGAAEATTLPTGSVDLVTAGQAFHWFDPARARAEFLRILRPEGWVVLLWNERITAGTPFLEGYERILQEYGTDYREVTHRRIGEAALRAFFGDEGCRERRLPNRQSFDHDGLRGRLLSSSYAPLPGQPGHDAMLRSLEDLFRACREDGRVHFDYDTTVYWGRLR